MEHSCEGQPSAPVGWFYKDILSLRRAATAVVLGVGIASISSFDGDSRPGIHAPNIPAAEAKDHSQNQIENADYTTIRDEKNGIYLGYARASKGDTFTMAGTQRFEDAPYGVIYINENGTYKCGYINPVLPAGNAPAEAADFCAENQDKIDTRTGIYDRINCPEKNGSNTCDGPTHFTRIRKPCSGTKKRVYRNFTPAGKNILNVMGKTVDHPFSGIVTDNEEVSYVHFRTKSKYKSLNGILAAVVLSDDVENQLGWGYFRFKCLQPNQLRDGSPSED